MQKQQSIQVCQESGKEKHKKYKKVAKQKSKTNVVILHNKSSNIANSMCKSDVSLCSKKVYYN